MLEKRGERRVSLYEEIIQAAVDHIEECLADELRLEDLAKRAGFSPFHFHRVFQALTGETVMEYIRKRRLACAAFRVAHSDARLLDICLDYCFGSPETFIRAFRRLFGMTPGEYRKRRISVPLYSRVHVGQQRFNPYLGGIRMEYRLTTKPAFHLLGYELRTRNKDGENHRDIPQFWIKYMEEGRGRRLMDKALSNAEYGACDTFDMETGDFSYIIGVEVKAEEGESVPEGLVFRSYPETEYAVFTTPQVPHGEFSDSIQSTWNTIFAEWFPHSGYEHSGGAEFEYYDERCWRDRNELVQMDIYIPVKKVSSPAGEAK